MLCLQKGQRSLPLDRSCHAFRLRAWRCLLGRFTGLSVRSMLWSFTPVGLVVYFPAFLVGVTTLSWSFLLMKALMVSRGSSRCAIAWMVPAGTSPPRSAGGCPAAS